MYYSERLNIENPQNAGAVGSAVITAIGLGLFESFAAARQLIPAAKTFSPNRGNKSIYDRQFKVFTNLYRDNKKSFAELNSCK
jgi:xylulokinase